MASQRRHSPFRHMSVQRLRAWLLIFFVALLIPSGLLIRQAYTELQWEAFHQQRIQAEELAARIDAQLLDLVKKEEKRGFSDYSFLNVTSTVQSNVLQRSPLASFPVTSDIPGLMGYFQVDADGRFSTPLLPDGQSIRRYGISSNEYKQRLGLQLRLLGILDKNRLVKRKPKQQGLLKKSVAKGMNASGPMESDGGAFSDKDSPVTLSMEKRVEPASRTPAAPPVLAEEETARVREILAESAPVVSQQAFDRLNRTVEDAVGQPSKARGKFGKVTDLKLDDAYQSRADKAREQQVASHRQKNEMPEKMKSAETKARREVSRLPEAKTESLAAAKDISARDEVVRVRTFESEIDAFELSLLDSGHFVLYRKVWRNGQRIIQGLLIEQQPFIEGMFKTAYDNTALSTLSHLLVAWQGEVISRWQASSQDRYFSRSPDLEGTLLYQTALTQPLGDIELIFSISQLPVGPGADVINRISGILLLVMVIGFYLAYRSGVKHIQLVQQQQDFVSAVSHELKTPLTSIRMHGEMLQADWASEEKKKTYYDLIVGESERLTRLINNILQLARFSRNAIQSDLRDTRISELIDLARSATDAHVRSAGFQLQVDCNETIGQLVVHVDTDHFIQIMINLVDNALKFSAHADNRTITLACHQATARHVQMSLRDHGPGIPKDQMKKIFSLFYRAENELTRETVGTGIGLALVNQLVREMAGEIGVQNANPGARFILTFRAIA